MGNPYDRYNEYRGVSATKGFSQMPTGGSKLDSMSLFAPPEQANQNRPSPLEHAPYFNFPTHLYPPPGAQTIDARKARQLDPATNFVLIDIICPQGGLMVFTHYGVYNDGQIEQNYEFIPQVNGQRIFPFHGSPQPGGALPWRISLGLAPDLSNTSLIIGHVTIQPGQRLTWTAYNNSLVATNMGVRVVGYFDTQQKRVDTHFGG